MDRTLSLEFARVVEAAALCAVVVYLVAVRRMQRMVLRRRNASSI